MARMFIVVGDGLSSGGSVVTGSPFTDIDGRPMARVGDRTLCPAHGPGTIITGDATLIVDGNAAARHGDWVSCGCQLIAGRQNLVFVDEGASAAKAPSPGTPRETSTTSSYPARQPEPTSSLASRRRAPACWVEDHQMEVATNAYGRYYLLYDENGDPLALSLQRKFKISIPLKSTGNIEVLVRIKAVAVQTGAEQAPTVSDEDMATSKTRMEAGIEALWNNKFTMDIFDPACGTRTFPIEFKVEWVVSGHHYTMNVAASRLREHVQNMNVNVWKETTMWTFAHEYAHCFGVADEYSYHRVNTWTLKYFRPDGTLDPESIQIPVDKPHDEPGATIMSTYDNTSVELRHAWQIALEVQEFLTRQTRRAIECSVG